MTHVGKKNAGKPREQFDYNHKKSDMKTPLYKFGEGGGIEGKIRETQWISNKKDNQMPLKRLEHILLEKKVKNWKLSMKQETTVYKWKRLGKTPKDIF